MARNGRLVCTLGDSWAVVPEVLAFLDPVALPLLGRMGMDEAQRSGLELTPPAEVWIVTTDGPTTLASLRELARWWPQGYAHAAARVWRARGTHDLTDADAIIRMRELIYRTVMHAAAAGPVLLSLAGGRKTMSADLQAAAGLFGATAVIHVATSALPEHLRAPSPSLLLPAARIRWEEYVRPVVVGTGRRSELLEVEWDDRGPVTPRRFPLPDPTPLSGFRTGVPRSGLFGRQPKLVQEVRAREAEGTRVVTGFLTRVSREERLEGWRSLYRLAPQEIEYLRETTVSPAHEDLLRRLPKADLHRHLGGVLDLEAQRTVGRAVWSELRPMDRLRAETLTMPLLRKATWNWNWPELLRDGCRAASVAALLVHASDDRLRDNLFHVNRRRALQRHRYGFRAYERPGELMGSAILGHPAALEPYAEALYEQSIREGLKYVEVRGSPFKYLGQGPRHALEFLRRFAAAIRAAERHRADVCATRFIVSTDRRDKSSIEEIVNVTLRARDVTDGFVVALDLAGDESKGDAEELAPHFKEAFEACLPITIHAGEGTPPQNIWKATYLLHADRIGHGLALAEHPELAQRFRNRGICTELCPTSNLEVVGFRERKGDRRLRPYPLRVLLDLGLPIALCTDNPFICSTTLAREFVVASALDRAGGGAGLSLWEAVSIAREAFVRAFVPASTRGDIMRAADPAVFDTIKKWLDEGRFGVERRLADQGTRGHHRRTSPAP